MTKIDRELDKLAREIDSEKIYVQEVASSETREYLKDKAEKEAFKKIDKAFLETETEVKPEVKISKSKK